MKGVLIFIVGAALFAVYSILLWRDGYYDGVATERRNRIRSFIKYQAQIQEFRNELELLQGTIDDLKKKITAETKQLAFNYEHTHEPIGKVVGIEECDGGLKFTISNKEEMQEAIDAGLTPVQKEALDSLCN